MVTMDNILSANFDAKKLSKDELYEARTILRNELKRIEKKRIKAHKKGLDTSDLSREIRKLDQKLASIRTMCVSRNSWFQEFLFYIIFINKILSLVEIFIKNNRYLYKNRIL